MGIFEKFKIGLKKSAANITSGLKEIIIKKEIDKQTLDNIEEFLISCDVGIWTCSFHYKQIFPPPKLPYFDFWP